MPDELKTRGAQPAAEHNAVIDADNKATLPVPRRWLAATAKLLNEMAGDGIGMQDCEDPADLMTELAAFLGVAHLDDCWVAAVEKVCAP